MALNARPVLVLLCCVAFAAVTLADKDKDKKDKKDDGNKLKKTVETTDCAVH